MSWQKQATLDGLIRIFGVFNRIAVGRIFINGDNKTYMRCYNFKW